MTHNDYQASVAAYAGELRGLFAQPAARAVGVATTDELADRAERLAGLSAELTRSTAGYLVAGDSAVRLGAERHLLAQAAASLQVADALLAEAARAGETEAPVARRGRVVAPARDFDDLLAVLETPLAEAGAVEAKADRGVRSIAAISSEGLLAAAEETLNGLLDEVAGVGQDVLAGLMGLDVALLKQAAGMVSEELGQVVSGISEQASRLVAKAVTFLIQTYDNLLAALGEEAAGDLRQKAAEWIERLQEGEAMAAMLDSVLQVGYTRDRVRALIEASNAPGPVLAQTSEAVAALPAGFAERTKLVDQILAGLGVIKRFPFAHVPMAELATAVTYITLLGFTVYVGADYVDAPVLERLGRIPGVMHVVETGLLAA